MCVLEDFDIRIPGIWKDHAAWSKAIDEAEGPERDLIQCQRRAANLLRDIPQCRATAERLAWLSIWTKTFLALQGARAAFMRDSLYSLKIIARTVFEGQLHILAINEPGSNLYAGISPSEKVRILNATERCTMEQVLDRLRAYTAWCLWSDVLYYREILDERTLDGAYDTGPAEELSHELALHPDRKELYEAVLGTID